MCGYFLLPKKCDLRPTKVQRCLGMLYDSDTTSVRVPTDKMVTLHNLLSTALAAEEISFCTLERIAWKCMSMTVSIRLASLWTLAMFAALSKLEKSGLRRIDLSRAEEKSEGSSVSGYAFRPHRTRARGRRPDTLRRPSPAALRTHPPPRGGA